MTTEDVQRHTFGWDVPPSEYRPARDVVTVEGRTVSGNVPLRIGKENEGGQGWSQSAYVVLTPSEAVAMAAALGAERDRYAVLAEARMVLGEMYDERERTTVGDSRAYDHGRTAEACERAEVAVFNVLNILTNYWDDPKAAAVLGV